jgi:hypothetical protein
MVQRSRARLNVPPPVVTYTSSRSMPATASAWSSTDLGCAGMQIAAATGRRGSTQRRGSPSAARTAAPIPEPRGALDAVVRSCAAFTSDGINVASDHPAHRRSGISSNVA